MKQIINKTTSRHSIMLLCKNHSKLTRIEKKPGGACVLSGKEKLKSLFSAVFFSVASCWSSAEDGQGMQKLMIARTITNSNANSPFKPRIMANSQFIQF